MSSSHEKGKGSSLLAQLYVILDTHTTFDEKCAEFVLDQQKGDINYQLPTNSALASTNPQLAGCTALHLAYKKDRIELFNLLLKYGADCTVANSNGSTVLDEIIADICAKGKAENAYLKSIIESYINTQTVSKSGTKRNLAIFHAACISGKLSYVQSCLRIDTAIDHLVDFPNFEGYTSLHLAVQYCNHEVIEMLLKKRPNLNLKNARKLTPLQMVLERHVQSRKENSDDEQIIVLLLTAHDKPDLIDDESGLSVLHVACTLRNASILESILATVQDVDRIMHSDSPIFPGYSALHFAAVCNFEAVILLMRRGANILLKNSSGKTPFDFCMERYEIMDVYTILAIQPLFQNILLTNGTKLLNLILAIYHCDQCQLCYFSENAYVLFNSPLWPSYSVLHVAVMFAEKKCINGLLVIKQLDLAHLMACHNQCDEFPLHLAFRMNRTIAVYALLDRLTNDCHNAANQDQLTFLHIACAADKEEIVKRLLLNYNEVNRQLRADYHWARWFDHLHITRGSTALHIAVMIGSHDLAELLLKKGANPYMKDVNDMTPIHWLLVLKKSSRTMINLLLKNPKLPAPEFPAAELPAVESVPVTTKKRKRKRRRNGNFTPINYDILKVPSSLVDIVANNGLTHLHVASFYGNEDAVQKLLRAGSNINATINPENVDDSKKFPGLVGLTGYTALDLAMKKNHANVVQLLLSKGANILVDKPDGSNSLLDVLLKQPKDNARVFVDVIGKNDELQNRVFNRYGLTMFHLYVYIGHIEAVKKLLEKYDFIDSQINLDSPIWPGFMALHLLIRDYQTSSDPLLQSLLDKGSDVTKSNADGCTPLHLAYYLKIKTKDKVRLMTLLVRHQKVFENNPTDKKGLSHFHIACALDDIQAMKAFLEHGVDVNQPVDHFHDTKLAGYSALHLALKSPFNRGIDGIVKLEAIDLIIKHGADVHARDARGNTPLHFAVKYNLQYMALTKRLLDAGARDDAVNMMGQTVFEILLGSMKLSVEAVEFFLTRGCRINNFNPITHRGYMAIVFSKYLKKDVKQLIFEKILDFECVKEVDQMSRNAVHNLVSSSTELISVKLYADMFQKLSKLGCDIDHQDRLGRTPLHIATQFRNYRGIMALLNAGADVNIIDGSGKTAFAYATEPSSLTESREDYDSRQIVQTFAYHVQKLNLCLLDVHEMNHTVLAEVSQNYERINVILPDSFNEELMMLKSFKIETTELTLLDFISETKAVVKYSTLPQTQRLAIDKYIESIDATLFIKLIGIIRLQYRKALAKLKLHT